jgi:hypothetical protein
MQEQSMLGWVFESLGIFYTLMLMLATCISFAVTLILVLRGRGPLCGSALLLIVPMPFLVGIFGAIDGAIRSYMVIAGSASAPHPSEVAIGISTSLVAPLVGLFLMGPGYLLAAGGMFLRALTAKPIEAARV